MTSVNQKASIENPLKENFKTDIKNNQILKLRFETAGTKNETLAGFRLFKMISTVLGSPSLTQQKLSIFEISQGSTLAVIDIVPIVKLFDSKPLTIKHKLYECNIKSWKQSTKS